ncbi:MAG: class I SAM-dependent DNA methyltransferase [Alphaproteobacteria bacterium]
MTDQKLDADTFIAKWAKSDAGERSNFQPFLREFCRLIGVPAPDVAVADERQNAYVFERTVRAKRLEGRATTNFIDCYKRDCFVLEAKQSRKRIDRMLDLGFFKEGEVPEIRTGSGKRGGAQWDAMMRSAREQAENYAKMLPESEGWPPFLVVVDVGHVIELYADFSRQGKHYAQFPDRQSYRIYLEDLRDPEIRERLRLLWTDPMSLNPAKRTAEVTREIADFLARLSKSLEKKLLKDLPENQPPEKLAQHRRAIAEKVSLFLMRCLFTMFAEDVKLLPKEGFTNRLKAFRGRADKVHFALTNLWDDMNKGTDYSSELEQDIRRFNGGLFRNAEAVEIDEDALELLILAAERNWQDVEPAIFGTLLERALDPRERAKLGAHYTPRAYVERLVNATIIDPLQEEWRNVRAAATQLAEKGERKKAIAEIKAFHETLCKTTVLDPACGTGNFLYVAMELMKRLEGEVLELLADLGEAQYILGLDQHTIDPHQFLGLEINPRAVAIAELVLWIGYLQWHFRTRGDAMPSEPVLKNFRNIQEKDAILDYDSWEVARNDAGNTISRWDGFTFKPHPITGEMVPDEAARVELRKYKNPKPASWPQADFIVGNPPFIGGKDMRQELGDGYAESCWKAAKHIPGGADFVMHFWDKAAEAVRLGTARRFGLITTNSITQKFSRKVIERHLAHKKPLSLIMAIPDHPWLKSADTAAVRIAMTVGAAGARDGLLQKVVSESDLNSDAPKVELSNRAGKIHSDFTVGPDLSKALPLQSNEKLCSRGVSLHGAGFIVSQAEAAQLGLGKIPGLEKHILPYRNGRDIADRPRNALVIDLFSLSEEDVRSRFPGVYQRIVDRVKPERDQNNRKTYRDNWWIFGEPRREWRPVTENLKRYITTIETSKHRFFQFLDAAVRPDNKLVNIGLDDAWYLSVLSSHIHVLWALNTGGLLEDRPVYIKTFCFDPFPFPAATDAQKAKLRRLGEALDAHRKERLAAHGFLTMTKMYNVLEKVRAGSSLTDAERDIYEAGLIGVLKQLHDDIDAATAEAYGWPADLSDEEILERLVALNRERAAEEREGQIRWLRPDFQAPQHATAKQARQVEADLVMPETKRKKPAFAASLPDQVAAIRGILVEESDAQTAAAMARHFSQGKRIEPKVVEVLETLAFLGQVEKVDDKYVLNS